MDLREQARSPRPRPKARWPRPKPIGPGSLSGRHAFLSQELPRAFQILGVGATLRDETGWYAVHVLPASVVSFEYAHSLGPERMAYNAESIERVRRARRTVRTEHAGFSDFWVPIAAEDDVEAVLVTGPLAHRRPTSSEVLERWRWLTGRQGHPSDPEFSRYLSTTLGTLTLEGDKLECYRRWLECYALLVAGRGDAHAIAAQAGALQAKLEPARFAEQMWETARSMVDEQMESEWLTDNARAALEKLGLERLPEHALVALVVNRRDDPDVVGELLRRDAFQRACVDVASSRKLVAGRIADIGVMFLLGGVGSSTRVGALFRNLTDELVRLAEKSFGLRLHLGTSALASTVSLSAQYDQALRAAEQGLSRGIKLVHAASDAQRSVSPIRVLRLRLAAAKSEPPVALRARFEQYLQAVGLHAGYRLESVRMHLEVGFDLVAQTLLSTGALSEKAYLDACLSAERAARDAGTVVDLFTVYRRAASDLAELATHPTRATQDHSLRRAVTFIHRHFGERLTLTQVASIAGFAPRYFSQLFRRREGMTLDAYVRRLRIERAKQLLKGTDLSAERISQLAGFALRPYFYRVFKEDIGMTPLEYRSGKLRTRSRLAKAARL